MNIKFYKTIIFDCDGVILNSNTIKSDGFKFATSKYCSDKVDEFIEYHKNNGGVSRYVKFKYFLEVINNKKSSDIELEELLKSYQSFVLNRLLTCEVASELTTLKSITNQSKWLVASGGDEEELRQVFRLRKIDNLFDSGIFGSPTSKQEIINREIRSKNIVFPALFIGDSKLDYECSREAGMDFIFLSKWSEVKDFDKWTKFNDIKHYHDISELILKIEQ